MGCLHAAPGGVDIHVKVVPGASRDAIAGPMGDALKVRVSAPPEKGKANRAVCELLAEALGLHTRDVEVIGGHTSPRKIIRAAGLTVETARAGLHCD